MTAKSGKEATRASAAQEFDAALADGREALAEPFPPRPVSETGSPGAIGKELDDALHRHLPCSSADSLRRINIDFDSKVREIIWRLNLRLRNLRIKYFLRRNRETILSALRLCALLPIFWLIYHFREELLAALSVPVEAIGRVLSLLLAPSGPEDPP